MPSWDAVDETLRAWIQESPSLAYLVLASSALIEYVFPPFPGDSIAIAAIVLAARSHASALFVWLSLTLGSLLGGQSAWWLGTKLAHLPKPKWVQGDAATQNLQRVRNGFRQHGAAYLLLNRFLPAFRSFFFVGAGACGVSWRATLLYGGIGAAVWNALLVGLGYWAAPYLALLKDWRIVTAAAVLAVGVVVFVVRRRKEVTPPS